MDNYTLPLKRTEIHLVEDAGTLLGPYCIVKKQQLTTCEVGTQTDPPMKEDPPQKKLEYPEREVIAADNSALLKDNRTPDDVTHTHT